MAESSQSSKSGGGCFSKLLLLILALALGGLASGVFFAAKPQDMTDIGGFGPAPANTAERDMKTVLKSAIDRNYAVTLSEAEINRWLNRILVTKQGGVLAQSIRLEHVWVRLEPNRAEIIMERSILGKPFTISMYLHIEQEEDLKGQVVNIAPNGGPYMEGLQHPPKGGRFGQLVVPQGFLYLVKPSYERLAALFSEEIELAFRRMARVTIEDNRIVLDPREPTGEQGMPLTF